MSKEINTILIVDDNRLPRIMGQTILKQNFPEITVYEAGNDDDALRIVQEHAIDLALLDINMPGLGGIGLAEQLLKEQSVQHICFISANIQSAMTERAEQLGAHFIAKPVTEEKLVQMIHQID